jgi:hypothetical protein
VSNTPTNKDDLVNRIARLEARLNEMDRKTLSNLSVTDSPTQIKTLQIDSDPANGRAARFALRDSSGNLLYGNDTKAGWGQIQATNYPIYPIVSDAATQITGGSYGLLWQSGVNILAKQLNYQIQHIVSGAVGTAGQFKLEWRANSITTLIYETTLTVATGTFVNDYVGGTGSYNFPSNIYGTGVSLWLSARLSAGVGGGNWAGMTPNYLQGHKA